MIQIYGGEPIASQRPFIAQTRKLNVPVFDAYIRENKTIFADAPQYGVPVVLNAYSTGTHSDVVSEIEGFVSEFALKVAISGFRNRQNRLCAWIDAYTVIMQCTEIRSNLHIKTLEYNSLYEQPPWG